MNIKISVEYTDSLAPPADTFCIACPVKPEDFVPAPFVPEATNPRS